MDRKKLLQNFSYSLLILSSCFIPRLNATEEMTDLANSAEYVVEEVSEENEREFERGFRVRRFTISEEEALLAVQKQELSEVEEAAEVLGIDLQAKRVRHNAKSCWSSKGTYFYQPAQHVVKTKGPKGELIELENGATFSVRERDGRVAAKWQPNTPVKICAASWSSSYDYTLYNEISKEYVEANLSAAPFKWDQNNTAFLSPLNWYIVGINQLSGDLMLDNGRGNRIHFQINATISEREIFKKWEKGDMILIGENHGWFGSDFIIIDIESNNSVSADRLS